MSGLTVAVESALASASVSDVASGSHSTTLVLVSASVDSVFGSSSLCKRPSLDGMHPLVDFQNVERMDDVHVFCIL